MGETKGSPPSVTLLKYVVAIAWCGGWRRASGRPCAWDEQGAHVKAMAKALLVRGVMSL